MKKGQLRLILQTFAICAGLLRSTG